MLAIPIHTSGSTANGSLPTVGTLGPEGSTPAGLAVGLLTGGIAWTGQEYVKTRTNNIMGGYCEIADLPEPRSTHVSFATPDDLVLVCGGWNDNKTYLSSCLQYDLAAERWRHHSDLLQARRGFTAASLDEGVYVFGGFFGREYFDTSEFLAKGSTDWTPGPIMPGGKMAYPCAVAIGGNSLLLIGGGQYGHGSGGYFSNMVSEYSSITKTWTEWPAMASPRIWHACSVSKKKVLVAGGAPIRGDFSLSRSTTVIDLETRQSYTAGNMTTGRFGFGMFEAGFIGNRVLLTFGSEGSGVGVNDEESLLQEWNKETEQWIPSPAVLIPKYAFAAITVNASLVCKPGKK